MARWENHGSTSIPIQIILSFIVPILQPFIPIICKAQSLLEAVEFRSWAKKNFEDVLIFRTKNEILEEVINRAEVGFCVYYFEFGVAFGETAKFLLTRISANSKYVGYDTFEGLPKAWRQLPKGAINANGDSPTINDDRFTFVTGFVENTVATDTFNVTGQKVIILDLDLYAPSLHVFKALVPSLMKDDIIYFDEAFDRDERVILDNYVIGKLSFEVIGISSLGMAIKIK